MTNVTRSPINGQIEADDIKSPNHYTWRGKECEKIIGEITQGAEAAAITYPTRKYNSSWTDYKRQPR